MKQLLIELNACSDARQWAGDKTWEEIYATCHRGDWLLWLFRRTTDNKRLLTLAKAHCANTVRHLMKDDRSKHAVDVAILYGQGEATDKELAAAAAAADDAYAAAAADDAYAYAAYAAAAAAAYDAYAYAAYAAAAADDAAAYAAYAAAAAAAADDAYARTKSQQATADICRKYLPIKVWSINF